MVNGYKCLMGKAPPTEVWGPQSLSSELTSCWMWSHWSKTPGLWQWDMGRERNSQKFTGQIPKSANAAMNNTDLLSNKGEGNDWYLRLSSDIHNFSESCIHTHTHTHTHKMVRVSMKATKLKHAEWVHAVGEPERAGATDEIYRQLEPSHWLGEGFIRPSIDWMSLTHILNVKLFYSCPHSHCESWTKTV